MDIKFSKLNLEDNKICSICETNIVENNISVCKDCSIKIKFLYSGIELKCIYCQFFLDYEYAYICQKCSKKNF
jgi:hypothetical protein